MSLHSLREQEVAQLIIDSLRLEGVAPDSLDPTAPLFNEGLGLDSIDALELSLAISIKYGFQIKSDDSENTGVFSNLRALSEHIESRRVK